MNLYGLKGIIRKPYWTKTSEAFYRILCSAVNTGDDILEFGSATGHISMRMARGGYSITLLDDRKDAIRDAKKIFKFYNVEANFVCKDFFEYEMHHDFIWNSGLIQCFDDELKEKLLLHVAELTNNALLFYPDTDSGLKNLGNNKSKHPGVDDAIEYSVRLVERLSSEIFTNVSAGTIAKEYIDVPFDMLWIHLRN